MDPLPLTGFILWMDHSWKETPAPGETKRKKKSSSSGKEIHFLRQRILKIALDTLIPFERDRDICMYRRETDIPWKIYFLNCCCSNPLFVKEQSELIFRRVKSLLSLLGPQFFASCSKIKILFFGKYWENSMGCK